MYLHTRLLLGIAAGDIGGAAAQRADSLRFGASRCGSGDRGHTAADIAGSGGSKTGYGQPRMPPRHWPPRPPRSASRSHCGMSASRCWIRPAVPLPRRHWTPSRAAGWPANSPTAAGAPQLRYPLNWSGGGLGALRVSANPRSEVSEIEERVESDVLLLVIVILAMAGAVYFMVRRGLRPVGQISIGTVAAAGRCPRHAAAALSGQGPR